MCGVMREKGERGVQGCEVQDLQCSSGGKGAKVIWEKTDFTSVNRKEMQCLDYSISSEKILLLLQEAACFAVLAEETQQEQLTVHVQS